AQPLNPVLELYPAQFNADEFSSVNHLSNALLTKSSWLAPLVTYAYGSNKNYGRMNFPLSFVTEGMRNIKTIDSTDLTYKVPMIGRPKKTSISAENPYTTGDKPGRGYSKFIAYFSDRWFFKSQSVFSPSG